MQVSDAAAEAAPGHTTCDHEHEPGVLPGIAGQLALKVDDHVPFHGSVELNNQYTIDTTHLRAPRLHPEALAVTIPEVCRRGAARAKAERHPRGFSEHKSEHRKQSA